MNHFYKIIGFIGNKLNSCGNHGRPGPGWSPYGPMWALMVPYGSIWALMGPPGQVLAGPDMSDFRLLVEFHMFWVQNLFSDEIYRWFCMAFAGEAEKTRYFDKKL